KQTIKRLVPVWNLSLDNNWGEQAQPIIYNGCQFRSGTFDNVAAGDTGCKVAPGWDARAPARTYRETVLRVNEAFPKLGGRNRLRARHVCGKYFVESIM